ncbi:uncharacterized protein DSM5745_09767 [Aspergillus mulundensis]|uniref:AttH domain-containing protein n=1 Tax=Aspergillus mulundensis TaxID=1810919 RepID=A0A3D8QRA7_9EURO|nr:Uncharacterized protein DSM5745_09767 [Aspergillus mulundensis]RDW64356.1 Uncharacterized protein DSM5745_09767 [Aspergillus mulundensis]
MAIAALVAFFLCLQGLRLAAAQSLNSIASAINNLPVLYDTSDIRLVKASHGLDSFWASSFIRTTDNRRFLVSANVIIQNGAAIQRAGILSLDDPLSTFPRNYLGLVLADGSDGTAELFNITTHDGRFSMETISNSNSAAEAFPSMRIFSALPDTEFDIDINMHGPAILNAGLGSFQWGGGIEHQISLPAARPSGTLVVGNKTLTIDSRNSLTWYDRQWGPTLPDGFTWFGLYVAGPDNSQCYLSVWNWQDSIDGDKAFVTIQNKRASGNTVIPIAAFEASDTLVFNSPASGRAYPLQYTVTLGDGKKFRVKSFRPDQEYVMDGSTYGFYSGYVEVDGDYTGFGVIDIP